MKKTNALSLVETLVAIAILLTIVAIIWLVVGPKAKVSAYESSVRADLQQIAMAINIYMADYDDQYPARFRDIPLHVPGTPRKATEMREPLPDCGRPMDYFYLRNFSYLAGERKYKAKFPWNPEQNAIVKQNFFC